MCSISLWMMAEKRKKEKDGCPQLIFSQKFM
jgi:hypothetical protein